MIYLLLAVLSSAMVSVLMRLSTNRIRGNISMLVMNYLMCLILSIGYTGIRNLLPAHSRLMQTIGMGSVHGFLYLLAFVLLQVNVKQNGVVLSSVFMKLGLLVPMVVSVCFFGERPDALQITGFCVAVGAIVLINGEKSGSAMRFRLGLIFLLLGGGCADAMSKVFEELGAQELSAQFLMYTFVAALALCIGLMIQKEQRPGKAELLFGFAIGIPNFFSARFLLKALETVPAVIVYPTYSVATILVVTAVGVLLFKERLGKRQWTAVVLILAALALLNL